MYSCHRPGNNSKPESTHPEIMTIYLYAWLVKQQSKIKQIYAHTEHFFTINQLDMIKDGTKRMSL